MADKKKRISWKTEYEKLQEKYNKLADKHNSFIPAQQKMVERLSSAESKLESRLKLLEALKSENDHFKTVSERDAKTKDEIRDIIYNRKYNTLFGGVSSLKADILKTL